MEFIDTHTHIYTEDFDQDINQVIERAKEAGARALLLPNINEGSIERIATLCRNWPQLCYPMMGLHPTDVTKDFEALLQKMEQKIVEPNHPFVAIGEIGIDLYWDTSMQKEQEEAFKRQIEWGIKYDLPLVIHSRNAHREIVETLFPYAEKLQGGIFHCFSGTENEAEELLSKFPGFCLGIGGTLTFKKSELPRILQRVVPIDRIVIETDAPYLAPVPYRGKRNEPIYLLSVLEKLAEIYEVPVEDIARITTRNAYSVFPGIRKV